MIRIPTAVMISVLLVSCAGDPETVFVDRVITPDPKDMDRGMNPDPDVVDRVVTLNPLVSETFDITGINDTWERTVEITNRLVSDNYDSVNSSDNSKESRISEYTDLDVQLHIAIHSGVVEWSIVATGPNLNGIPTGEFTYTGKFVENYVIAGTVSIVGPSTPGQFIMDVDFNENNGRLYAPMGSGSIVLEGDASMGGLDITINETNGSFQGSQPFATFGDETARTYLRGTFHGENASGVTGIYRVTGNVNVVGAIAGQKVSTSN